MTDRLSAEIAKFIITSLGKGSSNLGLCDERLRLTTFLGEGEHGVVNYPIYGGSLFLGETELTVLLALLEEETAVVYQMGSLPAVGIVYNPTEESAIFLLNLEEKWLPCNLENKANALLGFNKIMYHGMLWQKISNSKNILKCLEQLIEL